MAAGTLHVVATPIGNLEDLSPRAAEALRRASVVVAEDTRRTRTLLARVGARPGRLLSLPAFDERARVEAIAARLAAGEEVALVTDAGTPGVSDPGALLVDAAWRAGARVVPVPGPSAALAALSASGFPADRFLFAGFLPRKGGSRAAALRSLAAARATVVLFEAGNRAAATLADLRAALGDRPAVLARELTKLHEEILRGPLSALAARCGGELRGEVTIVVAAEPGGAAGGAGEDRGGTGDPAGAPPGGRAGGEGPGRAGPGEPEGFAAEPVDDEIRRRLAAGEPPTAVARAVARGRGLARREAYARVEAVRGRR
jgi:16S rRNA (cytidine1402-2'-O)-methyltransferase